MTLNDYATGEVIRHATPIEWARSELAAASDGGAGVITVDGRRCYVEGCPDVGLTERADAAAIEGCADILGDLRKLVDRDMTAAELLAYRLQGAPADSFEAWIEYVAAVAEAAGVDGAEVRP